MEMDKKIYIQPQTEVMCLLNTGTMLVVSPDAVHGEGDPNVTPGDHHAPGMMMMDDVDDPE